MNKRFEIAFEEVQEPIDDRTVEHIEEEHQRIAIELDEDSQELDYQSDLAEGLESLRYIASKLDTPSPTEVALFRVAANMAVMGTKQTAQDFLPAMESNKPIAMEGFGEKIKDVIKAIIAKLQEWWNKFKNFIKGLFSKEKIVKAEIAKTTEAIEEKIKEQAEPIVENVIITSDKELVNKEDEKKINTIEAEKKVEPNKPVETKYVKQPIKTETSTIYLDRYLISFDEEHSNSIPKITLKSINNTVLLIEGLNAFAIWTIVPKYIHHAEKYLKSFKSIINSGDDLIIDEIRKENRIRTNIVNNIIETADGDQYFTDGKIYDYGKDKPYYQNTKAFSTSFDIQAFDYETNAPFKFQLRMHSDVAKYVSFEQKLKGVRELLSDFHNNTDIISAKSDLSLVADNEKDIEKLTKEIIDFIKQYENKDSVVLNNMSKNLLSLCSTLQNVQKFSSNVFDHYYTTLQKKVDFYNKLINLYK